MTHAARYRQYGLILLAGLMTSCGSGGGSSPAPVAVPPPPPPSPPPALQATFGSIQANVLDPLCISCHIGASAPLGLRLDEPNSFAMLVGVPSAQEPGIQRVAPNDPDNSYLIQKLEGTASTGAQMPLGGNALPQADIDVIRQWITDGAQPDMPPAPPADPIRVSSLSVVPDSDVAMLPMTIMAMFDRELDATSINDTTFIVARSGGDDIFGNGNDVDITPVSVTVPGANPSTAVFDLSTTASVVDSYRISLVGTGPATILDLDGNALDGEFSGTFPSGDGAAGGNFEATFNVVGIVATLDSIQDHVFTPTCSGCHSGQGAALPGSMDLTNAAASFNNLVGVASIGDPAIERVEADDADASYLIQKLEGTAGGARMPPFGDPLEQETIDVIREWIDAGAAM